MDSASGRPGALQPWSIIGRIDAAPLLRLRKAAFHTCSARHLRDSRLCRAAVQATAGQGDFARDGRGGASRTASATTRRSSRRRAARPIRRPRSSSRSSPSARGKYREAQAHARTDRRAGARGRGGAGAGAAVSHDRPQRRRAADASRRSSGRGRPRPIPTSSCARRARRTRSIVRARRRPSSSTPGAPAAIRAMVETAFGPPVPREVQPGRGAEVLPGGAESRPGVGAGARGHRARARGRGSAQGRRSRREGARDRSAPRRRAPPARRPAPRRRSRRRGARRDRQGPRVQPVAARSARDARRDGLRQGRHRPPTTAKSRRRSRSIRPTARSTASPGSTPRATTASTKRRRWPRRRSRSIRRAAAPPATSACTCCGPATSPAPAARSIAPCAADPYDVVTFNLLKMLDNLDQFVTVKEGNIILKMHRDEAAVLREYAMPLAQEALKTLSARYGFTPTGPILIEIFPKHDDFAVRNLGLPGHDRRARRLLRPRRDDGFADGARSGHVQLAGHAVARAGARRHAADVEAADPAVAHRRDFGLRGDRSSAPSGGATWRSRSRARWTAARSSS